MVCYYYYYVSEHRLSLVIGASHTMFITCVNRDPKLLKLIVGDIVCILGGSRVYPGPRPTLLALN